MTRTSVRPALFECSTCGRAVAEVAGPLHRVRHVGLGRRVGAAGSHGVGRGAAAGRAAQRADAHRRRRDRGRVAHRRPRSPSSTACSAAGWSRARSRSSAASRAWARAPCSCRRSGASPPAARAACSCAPRSRPRRSACAPTGSACSRPSCSSSRRRRCRPSSPRSRPLEPVVLAIDSIQAVHDPDAPGAAGFGRAGARLRAAARAARQGERHRDACSSATSPRTARSPGRGRSSTSSTPCLSFEGDRHHALRMLRALKHRFGATDELGLLEMTDDRAAARSTTRARCSSPIAGSARPARSSPR